MPRALPRAAWIVALGAALAGCPTPAERGDAASAGASGSGAGSSGAAGVAGEAGAAGASPGGGAGLAGQAGTAGGTPAPTPSVTWVAALATGGAEQAVDAVELDNGNVLAIGTFSAPIATGDTTLTPDGVFLAELGGGDGVPITGAFVRGATFTNAFGATRSDLGNVFLVGHASGAITVSPKAPSLTLPQGTKATAGFLARRTPQGSIDRFVLFPSDDGTPTSLTAVVTVGSAIYVAGTFQSTLVLPDGSKLATKGGTDGFVARLSPSGDLVWARRVGGSGNDGPLQIASAGGLIHAFGVCGAELSIADGAEQLCSGFHHTVFDEAGAVSGPPQTFAVATPGFPWVTTDDDAVWVSGQFKGNLTIGGTTMSTGPNADVFVARLPFMGSGVTARALGDGGPQSHHNAAKIGSTLVVCGWMRGQLPLDGGVLKATGNDQNAFLAAVDPAGATPWGIVFPSDGANQGQSCERVRPLAGGAAIVSLSAAGAIEIGGEKRVVQGTSDAFFVRLVPP